MARAKRTERADARRRYRVEGPAPAEEGAAPAAAPAAPARRSIRSAFTGAMRPLDWRADLRLLPALLRHRSFLLPSLLAVLSTAGFVTSWQGVDPDAIETATDPGAARYVTYLAVNFFVIAPPAAGSFLAGFLAPRASWLVGALLGVVATACYAVIAFAIFAPSSGQDAAVAGIAQSALAGPMGAALFASAAAWYRRFLALANPNRYAARQQRPRSRARR